MSRRGHVGLSDRARRIATVAAILRDWSASPFEHEGACRHGIRAGLCLDGWPWPRADAEAVHVVSEALAANGATRPTWADGQPEWIDELTERTRCAWCGNGMPPASEAHRNGVPRKYCSALCGRLAYAHKARRSGEVHSMAEYLAACAARKEQTRIERRKPCKHCGTLFTPERAEHRFCSRECAHAGMKRSNKLKYVPCKGCGEPIHPAKGREYCSNACYHKHRERKQPERTCPVCGTVFRLHVPAAKKECCSRQCAWELRRRRAREAA
ncbi:hypothetical protein [Rhodospira trueperi]|uniref:Uncharacterized protein n=1 Tax=Rhodospira trueperi TaxID=69960 RepID=A0A1G6X3J1_9PROT|nr:hypothetical protein [Rhodospira trueperi]SDD71836.1 hypothetical protein SAMN05421720_101340 [Rhodospira trueperi]